MARLNLHLSKFHIVGNHMSRLIYLLMISCHASGHICCLLITFTNSLDPGQDRQNVGPDLDPNCLTLMIMMVVFVNIFFNKFILKKSEQMTTKA